jgi:DNA replication protein DnaC
MMSITQQKSITIDGIINTMPELWGQLKALKLSGIKDYLTQRNQEAITGQISYLEFLSMLLQDELLRREQSRFVNRIKQSGFKCDKTLERFDFNFNPKINQSLIKDLATGRFIKEKAPVLIIGPCGTGKSHLAQALGYCVIKLGVNVLFGSQTKIIQSLQTARAVGNYQKMLKRLTQVDLLILDDFALKPFKVQEEEDLHDIIAERYEQHSTIITSNLAFGEWQDAFQNKILAAATLDRLRQNAYEVLLDGRSYRASRQQQSGKESGEEMIKKEPLQKEEN